MSDMRLIVAGAGGRMGRTLVHAIAATDGAILAGHRPVRVSYALTDGSVPLAGSVLALDKPKGIFLLRTDSPLRETQLVDGLYPDTWSGRHVTFTRFRCRGGRVSAVVESDAHLLRRPQLVSSGGLRVRVPPGTQRTITAPLQRRPGAR